MSLKKIYFLNVTLIVDKWKWVVHDRLGKSPYLWSALSRSLVLCPRNKSENEVSRQRSERKRNGQRLSRSVFINTSDWTNALYLRHKFPRPMCMEFYQHPLPLKLVCNVISRARFSRERHINVRYCFSLCDYSSISWFMSLSSKLRPVSVREPYSY